MMLVPVNTGTCFYVRCLRCKHQFLAGSKLQGPAVYADLQGEPFKAYYCATCAAAALPREVTPSGRWSYESDGEAAREVERWALKQEPPK